MIMPRKKKRDKVPSPQPSIIFKNGNMQDTHRSCCLALDMEGPFSDFGFFGTRSARTKQNMPALSL